MSKIKTNTFLETAYEQVPRLLGQLNRNPSSKQYGSFDRAFWHYRTNDISCARYQEATYTLALLYCSNFEGNSYYRNEKVLEWIRAAFRFSALIQRKNGSFDEWYIHEGSYVATAFLTAALAQTVLLLRDNDLAFQEEGIVCDLLERSAQFLVRSKEETVMNQVSGAIFAIAATGRVCGRDDLVENAHSLAREFVSKQNKEGWWSEYGGPDIGYLTLTISYLEKYKNLTGSDIPNTAITQAKKFVEAFINPDMTAGGEFMSRNTEYIIPSKNVPFLGSVGPAELDDRYLSYVLYNWFEVGLVTEPQNPKFDLSSTFYSESKILREVNSAYFLVANAKKGNSFRIYAGDGVYYDSGLELESSPKNLSAGILDDTNTVTYQPGTLTTSGFLKPIKEPVLDTKIAVAFKAWQFIFGKISFLQKKLKDFLRPRMISYSKGSKIPFERMIEYGKDSIVVTDIVYDSVSPSEVLLGMKSSYSAVPSSKYLSPAEMQTNRLIPQLEESTENGAVTIKRVFSFKNQ